MKNADDDNKSDFKKFQSIVRRFHKRKDSSKNEHIIQKDVFHVRFMTANFLEKESEAINLRETEQISSKIKRHKRFRTRSNIKSKNHKKIFMKYLIYNIKEHSLSEY